MNSEEIVLYILTPLVPVLFVLGIYTDFLPTWFFLFAIFIDFFLILFWFGYAGVTQKRIHSFKFDRAVTGPLAFITGIAFLLLALVALFFALNLVFASCSL
ncbi:MAG: hypothetical protein V1834_04550 [Candidatus Micrarchaeota archaeon]